MFAQGVWYVRSKSDPRWNHNEEGLVGMFDQSAAIAWYLAQQERLGPVPDDLEIGYHKY